MLTKVFHRSRARKEKLKTLSSRPWANVELPLEVQAVPTMLYYHESQMLHWLAKHHANGSGRILDGGCFLGGSTAALASGLAARTDGNWAKSIASYDLFRVEPYTLSRFRDRFTDATIGASFACDFKANVAQWSDYVEVHEGDAVANGWNGEPIEILFLDFVKSWDLNDFVFDELFHCLIPGHSIIIQQDYNWGYGPWIHITMELLSPYVTVLDSMLCSTVYLLNKRIPKHLIGTKIRKSLSPAEQLRLMDQAVDRWTGQQRGLVELARVMLLSETRPKPEVQAELRNVLGRHADDEVVQKCGLVVLDSI